MEIKVSFDRCTGCRKCKNVCLYDAIEIVDNKAVINDNCVFCGACINECEFKAIEIIGKIEETRDFGDHKNIWVFIEQRDGRAHRVSLELLTHGRSLANQSNQKICGLVISEDPETLIKELILFGIDELYVARSSVLKENLDEPYAKIIVQAISRYKPSVFLAGATAFGRSVIPKVAAALGAGLTADCTELKISNDGLLEQTRPTFGGNIMATIITRNSRPQMATVRPRTYEAIPSDSREPDIINISVKDDLLTSRIKLIQSTKHHEEDINIEDYEVLVAGGRGIGCAENFGLLHELAKALGGAVAASRAVVDAGWVSYPHQVGQTGKTVKPKLYIACGISGAIQHLAGMQTSDTIIAINKDHDAPIFKIATYGIVGDVIDVIPRMLKKLKGSD